jgi:hypothetical protein
MSDVHSPWSVETAVGKDLYHDAQTALLRAEEIRATGKTVEIYHGGRLERKLKGILQPELGLNYDRFLV